MQLFLDFDGPILDNRAKYHVVHQRWLRGTNAAPMPADDYWRCKQECLPEQEILARIGLDEPHVEQYLARRLKTIEDREFLQFDRLWPGVEMWLANAARHGELHLVTLRKRRKTLMWQLESLGIAHHFTSICNKDANDGTSSVKTRLISAIQSPGERGAMIGDTEADIQAGRDCGLTTIAVTCGIRTPAKLASADPDVIVARLADVDPSDAASRWCRDLAPAGAADGHRDAPTTLASSIANEVLPT